MELTAGEPEPIAVPRGSKTQKIWRCPSCWIAVFSQYTTPAIRFVRAGTLDEPSSVAPDVHIYTRSKLPWVQLTESVPAFRSYYDPATLWPAESRERYQAALASRRRKRAAGQ